MVTGLLPVVGVPLPLVSFGGTAMVTLLAGFGLLLSVHIHRDVQIPRRRGRHHQLSAGPRRGCAAPGAHCRFHTPPQPWYTAPVGRVAQLAEQLTLNQRVRGSSPRAPTNKNKGLE